MRRLVRFGNAEATGIAREDQQMPFNRGDKVRLRGGSQQLTVVRIVGVSAHCSITRPDKSIANALIRLSDLEPATSAPAAVDAA